MTNGINLAALATAKSISAKCDIHGTDYQKHDFFGRGYHGICPECAKEADQIKFDAEQKAIKAENEARLKVSFFKPFWAGYNVIAVEDDYKHALVVGNNLKYLWILSREKKIPENVKNKFLDKAKEIGYNTSQLIWVEQK